MVMGVCSTCSCLTGKDSWHFLRVDALRMRGIGLRRLILGMVLGFLLGFVVFSNPGDLINKVRNTIRELSGAQDQENPDPSRTRKGKWKEDLPPIIAD